MVLGALEIFSGALVGGFWLILIGLFLRGAAQAGYYGVLVDQTLGRTQVRDIMVDDPITLPSAPPLPKPSNKGSCGAASEASRSNATEKRKDSCL
jgi:hypothetical protein